MKIAKKLPHPVAKKSSPLSRPHPPLAKPLRHAFSEPGADEFLRLLFAIPRTEAHYDAMDRMLRRTPALACNPHGVDESASLVHAAGIGDVEACRLLLKHGASPNDTDNSSGRTALHAAAEIAHPGLIRALLQAGARSTTDREGRIPVELCLRAGGDGADFESRRGAVVKLLGVPRYV